MAIIGHGYRVRLVRADALFLPLSSSLFRFCSPPSLLPSMIGKRFGDVRGRDQGLPGGRCYKRRCVSRDLRETHTPVYLSACARQERRRGKRQRSRWGPNGAECRALQEDTGERSSGGRGGEEESVIRAANAPTRGYIVQAHTYALTYARTHARTRGHTTHIQTHDRARARGRREAR